jgi:hypothetical protein
MLAELAEPAVTSGSPPRTVNVRAQNAFFERVWPSAAELLTLGLPAYARRSGSPRPLDVTHVVSIAPKFRKLVRAATEVPVLESLFPASWPAAATRVLPNAHPQVPATTLWGPVFAWILIQALAEAIDSSQPEGTAVSLFDRLRLREPLAQAFHALGLEGEEGWRAAARIKALLLVECEICAATTKPAPKPAAIDAKADPTPHLEASNNDIPLNAAPGESALYQGTASAVPKTAPHEGRALAPAGIRYERAAEEALASKPASSTSTPPNPSTSDLLIPPQFWGDPDICWLTGAHVSGEATYLVREKYEELLWWLQLPALSRMAATPAPHHAEAALIREKVRHALAILEAAGYRLDKLLEPEIEPEPTPPAPSGSTPATTPPLENPAQEPVAAHSVGPVNPGGPPEDY